MQDSQARADHRRRWTRVLAFVSRVVAVVAGLVVGAGPLGSVLARGESVPTAAAPYPSASIQITSPLAEDVWPGGVNQTITWTSSNLHPSAIISIWVHRGGIGWSHVVDLPRDATSYDWRVSTQPTTWGALLVRSWVPSSGIDADAMVWPIYIRNRSQPDLGADGMSDILWRHTSGASYLWEMAGATVSSSAFLPLVGNNWEIQGLDDIGGNGATDILWRESSSGSTYVWHMAGATVTSSGFTDFQADTSWTLQGLGDLGGDGGADVLWRHSGGALYLWEMLGTTTAAGAFLPLVGNNWEIEDLGDFDGDLMTDILWRENGGSTYLWLMDGPTPTGEGFTAAQADNTWAVEGVGDFNGDGRTDVVWRHVSGARYVWMMDGTNLAAGSGFLPAVGASWGIEELADFSGDGKTDILWREAASGGTYIWSMNGVSISWGSFTSSGADNTWTVQDP